MPDVNLLVYAHREDAPEHRRALTWLEGMLGDESPFALSALVAASFVRVVTNPAIYKVPSPLSSALDFVDEVLSVAGCRWTSPGPEHWKIFSRLCLAAKTTGRHVADAQHAAVAIEHGCTWVTTDGDFKRYASLGLDWTRVTF